MNENLLIKALKVKPFSYLILSEFFSQFSMNLFNFALLLIVFSIVSSNTAVSGVVIAFTIPSLLFGILAGILVDRWNKKNVLLWTNIIRALLVFPLFYFNSNLAFIYLITAGVATATQFFIPAETPIIPLLVKKELLLPANAIFGMVIYASIFLAYALSGPALYLFGKRDLFIVLAIMFLLAAFFSSLIRVGKRGKIVLQSEVLSFREETSLVLKLISKTKSLYHALFSLTLAYVLVFVMAAIGPGYAETILKIKVESFPILFVTPAVVGVALGAFIIGTFLHKIKRSSLTKFGLLLLGFSILLLPFGSKVESRDFVQFLNIYLPHILDINVLHIMVVLAFFLGFAISFIFVPANTVLQEETTDESRGKIYGLLNTLIGLVSIIPVLLVGSLADIIGVRSVIIIIGLIVLLTAFYRIYITDRSK